MKKSFAQTFEQFSSTVTEVTGSSSAFLTAFTVIIVWIVSGPIFKFSDTWQLVINTGTTIVTFLMVFLIQKSQNKDALATQIKLNELIATHTEASNRLLNVEDLSEAELRTLHKFFGRLADKARQDTSLTDTHSVDVAEELHQEKQLKTRKRRGRSTNA